MSRPYSLNQENKICFNCGNEKQGRFVPEPSGKDPEKRIFVCLDCYEDWYIK